MAVIIRVIGVGLAGALFLAPRLSAEQRPAPTVAVAGFVADRDSRLSSKAVDLMADGLAVQLVDSGRYRVLDRVWLGIESVTPQRTPIARVRDAARDAGVEYLVVGRISRFSETHRYLPPGASNFPPIGRHFSGYAPMSSRVRTNRVDYLRVSIELVDVTTGSVLTETSSSCPMPQKSGLGRTAPLVLLPSAPLAAVAALVSRSRDSSSGLEPGLARALTTAGEALIRWNPTAPRRP